jgi:HTH-type transcriptional regulator / antitoxin HigA
MSNLVAVRPIRNEEDFDAARTRLAEIVSAKPGTPEFDELDVLATLASEYERRHWPSDASPVEVVRLFMEDRGLSASDLAIYFGSQPRVSEFLNGKRPLTVEQIGRLSAGLGIPAGALVGAPGVRWRVPANRLRQVFDVGEPVTDSHGRVIFVLKPRFSSGRLGRIQTTPEGLDYEVLSTSTCVYRPEEKNGLCFKCDVEGDVAWVTGYHRGS